MKPATIGALIGAIVGFSTVLLLNVLVIPSGLLHALLFPGHLFIHYANIAGFGDFGLMICDFFAYFSNIALYAAIGWAVGWLLGGARRSDGDRSGKTL